MYTYQQVWEVKWYLFQTFFLSISVARPNVPKRIYCTVFEISISALNTVNFYLQRLSGSYLCFLAWNKRSAEIHQCKVLVKIFLFQTFYFINIYEFSKCFWGLNHRQELLGNCCVFYHDNSILPLIW